MHSNAVAAIQDRRSGSPVTRANAHLRYLDCLLESPEMQLLLACCRRGIGTAGEEELADRIAAVSNWAEFGVLCREHRLALIVQKVLVRPFRDRLPPAFLVTFEREVRTIGLQQMRLRGTLVEVHRAFLAGGIRHLFLKGPVLDGMLSGGEILRHSGDLDVLIDPSTFREADILLANLGFRSLHPPGEEPPDSPLFFIRRKDQGYVKKGAAGRVELHWRTDEVETLIKPGLFSWSDHVRTVPFQGCAVPVLADAQSCLYLCLHAAKHDWARLGWLMDIPRFMRKQALGREALLDLADLHGLRKPVLEAFSLSDYLIGAGFGYAELEPSGRSAIRLARRIRIIRQVRTPKLQTLLLTLRKGELYPGIRGKARFWFLWALNQGCARTRKGVKKVIHAGRSPARTFVRKVRTALGLPLPEKTWMALLFPLSGVARGALLILPFRHLAPLLGARHGNIQLTPLATKEQVRLAARIGAAVNLAARYTPWESRCLVQAFLVKTLLEHYRIPYALYLGVAKAADAPQSLGPAAAPALKAHAWVTVGPRVVSGRDGHLAFTVVSTFVSPALLRPC